MKDDFRSRLDPTARLLGASDSPDEVEPKSVPDDVEENAPESRDAFSMVSSDRRQKVMLELRFKNGNAKALSYSYLVSIDFDPSAAIRLDFSGYDVQLSGLNLGPLFTALVAQRVAIVRETDELHATATLAQDATVVTRVEVKARAQD